MKVYIITDQDNGFAGVYLSLAKAKKVVESFYMLPGRWCEHPNDSRFFNSFNKIEDGESWDYIIEPQELDENDEEDDE